jgi:hypothetical protein
MKVVSKSEDTLKRFMKILDQEDPIYYVGHVENLMLENSWLEGRKGSELTCYELSGLVANSIDTMLDKSMNGTKISTGAMYMRLRMLCRLLDFGIEIWARCEDSLFQFQQWYMCDHKGRKDSLDSREWYAKDEDDEDDEEEGGFDDYGEYNDARTIYGRR